MTSANVLQELEWRGFVQQATPGLAVHFAKGPVTAYCGFDPTAPSLQLGNLMPLMLLANLQRAGNRPIVLMGGGTGLIGDPSGKAGERPLLSRSRSAKISNASAIRWRAFSSSARARPRHYCSTTPDGSAIRN